MTTTPTVSLALIALCAAAGVATLQNPARGADAAVDLGPGGTVRGDIDRDAAEVDAIAISLVAGCTLDVKFSPGFNAEIDLLGPAGGQVDLPLDKGESGRAKFTIQATGRHEFRIRSADESGGFYKLIAKPTWDKKLVFEGTDAGAFPISTPASSRIKAKVKAAKGATLTPNVGLMGPGDTQVVPTTPGKGRSAKFGWADATTAGDYTLTVGAESGSGAFSGTVKRKVPKVKLTKVDARNGLTPISFTGDGVDQVFKSRCASCHNHNHASLGTYGGAKRQAIASLGRMRTGNMPKGARMPASEIRLIEEWIKTGKAR